MKDITKKYTNGEVTIVWQPAMCIHSTICWKAATGMPHVFDPREKPWVKTDTATTNEIVEQIKKCPSGALSYYMNNEVIIEKSTNTEYIIEISENGPLLVHGDITVKDKEGNISNRNKITAFCRCGASGNKPYCDGSHNKIGFEG